MVISLVSPKLDDATVVHTLTSLGISNISKEQDLYTTPIQQGQRLEVISAKVTDTTLPHQRFINSLTPALRPWLPCQGPPLPMSLFPSSVSSEGQKFYPAPILFATSLFRMTKGKGAAESWVLRYIDPTLFFDITPLEFRDVEFWWRYLTVTGTVTTKFANQSSEGQTYEQNEQTGETRNQQYVSGSADLSGSSFLDTVVKQIQKAIERVRQEVSARVNLDVNLSAKWKAEGGLSILRTFFDMLRTGKIHTDHGIDATLDYYWQGSKSISKHIDLEIWLPVNGDVQHHAWDKPPG